MANKPIFEFDRYVNGTLMAEGVTIERENTLDTAMKSAARLASKGPNGEAPVLVYRPAAPVAGLETVTYRGKYIADGNGAWDHYPSADVSFDPDKYEQEALVTRSQAEAIIAAERAEKERLAALLHKNGTPRFNAVCERAERAEAENAALTARVKELEIIRDSHSRDTLQALLEKQAIETQLAARNKLLAEFAKQKLYGELTETEMDGADFEGAYDIFIKKSRATLDAKP